jgi:hypothetical protein
MNSDSRIRAPDANAQTLDRAKNRPSVGAAHTGGLNRGFPAFADYFRPSLLGRIGSFNDVCMVLVGMAMSHLIRSGFVNDRSWP